jgi:flagellar motility protein MotE (MotC chaperone)
MRWLRDFRLVPVVLAATIALFALKTLGLVLDGGYTLGDFAGNDADDALDITGSIGAPKRNESTPAKPPPQPAKQSWAQQMFNYPDVTGSVGEVKTPEPPAAKGNRAPAKPLESPPNSGGTPVPLDRVPSPGERAVLERLQERRTELDARARELDLRENLLKAAEKRLEGRVGELKDIEARVNNVLKTKDEGEAARFKNLVTMYENMKAKDAAKIFDRLDLRILVEVATQLNPRRMSDILAQMTAETAERLTVELATRSKDKGQTPAELPKIEGRPLSN